MEDLHLDRLQPEVIALHVADARRPPGPAQRSIEIVDPAMEGADDGTLAMTLLAIDDARAAMAAEIVEGPHRAVLPAHDDGALAEKIEGDPVAGGGNVADMADNLPMGEEQLVALEIE